MKRPLDKSVTPLCLQSVLAFLTAVEVPLFLGGRSTGTSVTSTKVTSVSSSGASSWRLLGSRNCPERTKMFSTLTRVRHTVASETPKSRAM